MNATTTLPPHSIATPKSLPKVGDQIRHWRSVRRLSQFELAEQAAISTRHLSFVETGRATPSRELLLRFFERLHVPLRARNSALMAGGYAPMYHELPLDHPSLQVARTVVETVVHSHAPFPALAVDRQWNLLVANAPTQILLKLASPALLEGPCNIIRLALHPLGLAPYIRNLPVWRAHLFHRLERQLALTDDPAIRSLLEEIAQYSNPHGTPLPAQSGIEVALPVEFSTPLGDLSFISTITVFGTPAEVTLSEIALECFYPANEVTRARMLQLS
jgi:transcriptional regulator with XRE-family HTH domain